MLKKKSPNTWLRLLCVFRTELSQTRNFRNFCICFSHDQAKIQDLQTRIIQRISKIENVDQTWTNGKEWADIIYFPALLEERLYCHFRIGKLSCEFGFTDQEMDDEKSAENPRLQSKQENLFKEFAFVDPQIIFFCFIRKMLTKMFSWVLGFFVLCQNV